MSSSIMSSVTSGFLNSASTMASSIPAVFKGFAVSKIANFSLIGDFARMTCTAASSLPMGTIALVTVPVVGLLIADTAANYFNKEKPEGKKPSERLAEETIEELDGRQNSTFKKKMCNYDQMVWSKENYEATVSNSRIKSELAFLAKSTALATVFSITTGVATSTLVPAIATMTALGLATIVAKKSLSLYRIHSLSRDINQIQEEYRYVTVYNQQKQAVKKSQDQVRELEKQLEDANNEIISLRNHKVRDEQALLNIENTVGQNQTTSVNSNTTVNEDITDNGDETLPSITAPVKPAIDPKKPVHSKTDQENGGILSKIASYLIWE